MGSHPSVTVGALARKAKDAYGQTTQSAEVKWDLVKSHLPLLKSIVARMRVYFPRELEMEDAYSIGLKGLIASARTFDPAQGRSFGAYAHHRIRGSILDELRSADRLSRNTRKKAKEFNRQYSALEQRLGRKPSEEEAAADFNISVNDFRLRLEEIRPVVLFSIDEIQPSEEGGDRSALERLQPVDTDADGRDVAEHHELVSLVREELERLPKRHKRIMSLFHYEGLNLSEIAKLMNLSQARVSQLKTEAIISLRSSVSRRLSVPGEY